MTSPCSRSARSTDRRVIRRRASDVVLKLSVTLLLEAHCPKCSREGLPLGENSRFGVVAVCPGCGWEHQVQFLKEGIVVDTAELLGGISSRLHEALGLMELPQDVHLIP